MLTIHDGKGKKDRTVPLPQSLFQELHKQMEEVKKVYLQDLKAGYSGTFLFGRIEEKYKGCAKDLVWQWFFPARQLTKSRTKKENAAIICMRPMFKKP